VARRLRILKVSTIALHRGLYVDNPLLTDTSWMAWQGLVAHGWKPLATDGPVTSFVRGASSVRPPFPEPAHNDALFCSGWFPPDQSGRQMSSSHAALWAQGPGIVRLFLISPEPLPVTVSLDGRPHTRLVVDRLTEVRVGLSSADWHLIALDTPHLVQIRGKPRGVRIVAYALPQHP
jgi:hypothetical protein